MFMEVTVSMLIIAQMDLRSERPSLALETKELGMTIWGILHADISSNASFQMGGRGEFTFPRFQDITDDISPSP